MMGVTLGTPLFPLYLVRDVQASDAWIGVISTAQTAILIVGYFFWTNQSRQHGSRRVLLLASLGLSFYPALVSLTHEVGLIVVYAGLAGIFQAGLDLVFFDELMKTVPIKHSATFVSVFQSMNFFSSIVAPIVGTTLADTIGLSGALMCSFGLRFLGFCLFAFGKPALAPVEPFVEEQKAG
jgi:MFS family permease